MLPRPLLVRCACPGLGARDIFVSKDPNKDIHRGRAEAIGRGFHSPELDLPSANDSFLPQDYHSDRHPPTLDLIHNSLQRLSDPPQKRSKLSLDHFSRGRRWGHLSHGRS